MSKEASDTHEEEVHDGDGARDEPPADDAEAPREAGEKLSRRRRRRRRVADGEAPSASASDETDETNETNETNETEKSEASDAPPTPPREREQWGPRAWWGLFRVLYGQFDRRTLGFSRILLGFLLLMDVFHRGRTWLDMYSSVGVLPTPLNLQRPQAWGAFSIFNAFDSPLELKVLWALMAINAFCLMIGFRTKVAQMVAFVLQVSMNGRVLFVENGGYVVNNLLVLWTMFLPMGDRFSVDALLASFRRRKETTADALNDRSDVLAPGMEKPWTSAMGPVLHLQIAAIYYFNVIHKTGVAWHNGTAVHYVLYVDRMATPIVSLIRNHIPNLLVLFMTRATMAFEAAIPVLLLQPLARPWARRGVIFMMCTLHIAFGVTFVLGPFAWSLCVFATLFFSRDDWEIAYATMRRAGRARRVLFDPRSGGAILVCRWLKRLDGFGLLTFEAREGLPLGLAVQAPGAAEGAEPLGRADMIFDLVSALPLGPTVAWIVKVPGVRPLVDALLRAIEARPVSSTLGLDASPRADHPAPSIPDRDPAPWYLPFAVVAIVGGAVAIAAKRDQALSGVILVLVTTALVGVVGAWIVYPTLTFAAVRRAVFGSLRELIVLAMFAGAVDQALNELWVFNRRFKTPQPEALRLMAHKLRFLQGWFMFSPNPVMDDGSIVVDALTVDGRRIDPFTGKPPRWDLETSLGLNQIWCDYFNRIQLPGNASYRDAMKDYLIRLPERTGNPNDAIVSGDVYWVKEMNPRWGDTRSTGYDRTKLYSWEHGVSKPVDKPADKPADGGAAKPAR